MNATSDNSTILSSDLSVSSSTVEGIVESWKLNGPYDSFGDFISDPQGRDNLIAVTIWYLISLFALVSNLLLVLAILRCYETRFEPSYWFVVSSAFCDLSMVVIMLVFLVPAQAVQDENIFTYELNYWVMFFYNGFWYTYIVQLGVMSVNRLISITFPINFKYIFSKSRTLTIIGCDFLAGFLIALPVLFSCCRMPYYFEYLSATYENPLTWHRYLDSAVSIVPCPVMLFSYSFIFIKIRRSNKNMAAIKRNASVRRDPESQEENKVNTTELRLLIQFMMFSICYFLTWLVWVAIPYIWGSKWAGFTTVILFSVNNAISPIISFIFNKSIRNEVNAMLCSKKSKERSQSINKDTSGNEAHTSAMAVVC